MDRKLLQLNNISVVYSDVIQVLKGVSLTVEKNRIVSLLGSNGAGKTTTLKAVSGLLKPENGKVTDGTILYQDSEIQNQAPETVVVGRNKQPAACILCGVSFRQACVAGKNLPGVRLRGKRFPCLPVLAPQAAVDLKY